MFKLRKVVSLLDNFKNPKSLVPSLIAEVTKEISKLLHTCEEALESKRSTGNISAILVSNSLNPLRLCDLSGQNMLQAEAYFEERISTLEEKLKKREESKPRVHSFYQDCLRQLDHDIDKLIHDF